MIIGPTFTTNQQPTIHSFGISKLPTDTVAPPPFLPPTVTVQLTHHTLNTIPDTEKKTHYHSTLERTPTHTHTVTFFYKYVYFWT